MPKELHDKLEKEANQRGYTGKRKARFVYGTIYNIEHPDNARKRRNQHGNG